jgi:predicted transcriptional regulator
MDEGFIVSNKVRKALFSEIAAGETSLSRIIKKHHLIKGAATTAATELVEHGLVEKKDNSYRLTERGTNVYGKLRATEFM